MHYVALLLLLLMLYLVFGVDVDVVAYVFDSVVAVVAFVRC